MQPSKQHSYIGPRDVRPFVMDEAGVAAYHELQKIGINISRSAVNEMVKAVAMDAGIQALNTTASVPTPVQFLQAWLPGFVATITAARKIDLLVGISTIGSWEDEQVVQGYLEVTGTSQPYSDYSNMPRASWNLNFDTRTIVRFEEGLGVGLLEEMRAARVRVNSGESKRTGAAQSLEIQRNGIGFYGYNDGANATYGFLNDPNLPAYVPVAGSGSGSSQSWADKTFLEIVADLRAAFIALRTQSQDVIDVEIVPLTLAIATNSVDYLSVTSEFGNSVRDWLTETYPKVRVVSAPELNDASASDNVFYLYAEQVNDGMSTDDQRTFIQMVQSKFMVVGVAKTVKGYDEDYSNATAGVMLKRPFAIVRYSGI